MSTVRIYKVAELLNTSSQEVTALLKKMGIDVKSASSTIEEVVARQLVDRLARDRNISLPTGDIFAETPIVKGKKGGGPPAKKAAEPAKPVAPAPAAAASREDGQARRRAGRSRRGHRRAAADRRTGNRGTRAGTGRA